MRRLTHYDYWSDSLKPSILVDSRADVLVYGMGEKQVVEIAKSLEDGVPPIGRSQSELQDAASGYRLEAKGWENIPQIAYISTGGNGSPAVQNYKKISCYFEVTSCSAF